MEQIAKIIMHQRYSKDPETNYKDIALLKTRLPVQFSDIVQPVPLPRPLANIKPDNCVISGWGSTKQSKCHHFH